MYNFKYHVYVVRIQRLARRYLGRCRRNAAYRHLAEVRHELSQIHYYRNILAAAWQKFDRSKSQIKQEYELRQMAVEEDNIRSLTHLLTLTYLLTHSLTHSYLLTHSLTYSLTHSLTQEILL